MVLIKSSELIFPVPCQEIIFIHNLDIFTKFYFKRLLNSYNRSLNVGKSELPEHLSQLQVVKVEPIGSLEKKNRFSDVASKTDICHDVLRNILHVRIFSIFTIC